MEFVATLIAAPEGRLTRRLADDMARALGAQGVNWIEEGVACDIAANGQRSAVSEQVEQTLTGRWPLAAVDWIVQPLAHRRKKLLIADMESTIITCECLDELAEMAGIRDEIAAITARAMNGELDFETALRRRVGSLKGLPESALNQVMDEKVRLMPGARELVSAMKKSGAYTMLVSGGFDFYASRIAAELGFDEWRANRLEIKDGALTGHVIPPILGKEAKLDALYDACKKLGITPEDTLAVGDGANDLPMLLAAGLGVAYHAKPNVRAQARARIDHGDLRALLWAQGYR
ncbi:MAG: phosphoserine phosphatase SerB [Pseudomonadota bacterium]|nr:phosphoserine phosphatase SerB [Pseudomonadota bacterium]MDE3037598.1 phosphoserine phosphatase SerB [Pseudomonadota bacterium]